jgi:putative transposase
MVTALGNHVSDPPAYSAHPTVAINQSMSHSPSPKHKTCKRFNDPGHAHALNFACYHNRAFLSKDRSRHWLVDATVAALTKHQFHLWAYVIMPDHVHLLVWPTIPTYDISEFLRSVKKSVANRAIMYLRRESPGGLSALEDRQPNGQVRFRFWQPGGGYDRNLVDADAIHAMIGYIHANPVRKGLVVRPEDWLWSSAADYFGVREGPIPIHRESLPSLDMFEHRCRRR